MSLTIGNISNTIKEKLKRWTVVNSTVGTYGGWLACSDDGNTVLFSNGNNTGYLSKDAGITWNPGPSFRTLGLACSANGNTIYHYFGLSVTGYTLSRSTDGGANFTYPMGLYTSPELSNIKCSSDGTKVFSRSPYYALEYSSDSGATFSQIAYPSGVTSVYDVAMSDDGTKVFIVGYNGTTFSVYVSTTGPSGTFSQKTATNYNSLFGICCSSDGSKVFVSKATTTPMSGFYSTDSGATWTSSTMPTTATNYGFDYVSMTRDGSKLIGTIGQSTNNVFKSIDGGANWTLYSTNMGATIPYDVCIGSTGSIRAYVFTSTLGLYKTYI